MTKKKETKKKQDNRIAIGKILNSPISIMLALTFIIVGLMIYSRYLIKVTNLYTFSGFDEDFSILNGTIFTSYDINYFGDSKVLYTGEDKKLYDFEAGYYIKDGENYRTIVASKSLDTAEDVGVSLKDLIEKTDYSFTEVHKKAEYLSKENIDDIDKLVYRITAKDEDGEDIKIEISLDVAKVTK